MKIRGENYKIGKYTSTLRDVKLERVMFVLMKICLRYFLFSFPNFLI